jgi:putative ABC transport system substrate-binding protein
MSRLSRRRFVVGAGVSATGLGLLAGCGRLPWQAQPAPKIYRIGYLNAQGPAVDAPRFEVLQRGLRELGWIEGQNFTIERRLADGQLERLPALAAELAQLQPDVIVTSGEPGVRAMTNATRTIPLVFAAHGDPVGTGVVTSFAHPGGNITGVSEMAPELSGKRLELLEQAIPAATRVGAIWNQADQAMGRQYGETLVAAEALGIELQSLAVRTPEDLEGAYQAASRGRLDGVVVIMDPLIIRNRERLVDLSTKSAVPTISGDAAFAAAGGLMSYGPNLTRQTERAVYFVDRILRGAKPADLPVEQPMTFDFVVNLKTAQALGITFPNEIMLQVTEVIE